MYAAYRKTDDPPTRVKPIPVQVLERIMSLAQNSVNAPLTVAQADMIGLAFFFLLRPGEYTDDSSAESTPFRLRNVQIFVGQRRLDIWRATPAQLYTGTRCALQFEDQKNCVRNEVIGQARSGRAYFCPVRILVRRILHLREHGASGSTPLATAFISPTRSIGITSTALTTVLRNAVTFLGPSLGFLPGDVTARSLRAAGANALLCGGVDTDIIRLLGRWRSDEMIRYLHAQIAGLTNSLSKKMLEGGVFTLIPHQEVPIN